MGDDDNVSAPPSYTEVSSYNGNPAAAGKAGVPVPIPPPALHVQLAATRSQRINQIISIYIEPLLLVQGASGIFKTTFLLVPSNDSSLQHHHHPNPSSTEEEEKGRNDIVEGTGSSHNGGAGNRDEIVGFPASEYVKLVRLHGEEHTSEFWRQPAVLSELEGSLKARLASSGHRIFEPPSINAPIEPSPTSPRNTTDSTTQKRPFWSRKRDKRASASANAGEEDVTRDLKLGWRADGDGGNVVPMGETRVLVGMREVCLRVVTELGLFETRTGQAVGVTVEVGA